MAIIEAMLAGLVARSVDLIADGHVEHVAGDDTNAGDTVGVAAQPGDGSVPSSMKSRTFEVRRQVPVLFVDIEIAVSPPRWKLSSSYSTRR